MPKRMVAVVVAVAVASVVSAATYSALHSAQQKADKNATLTKVYVLKATVPRNESVAAAYLQGLITTTRLPLQFVPAGAVTNLSVIRDREAEYNLPAGEVVVNTMFVPPKANSSLAAATVPKGDVAVTVSVDQTRGVAGLIQPGDKVDILVDTDSDQEAYLYQLVPVLGVGTTLVPAPGTRSATDQTVAVTEASDLITFAVPQAAATRIAQASAGGGGVTGGLFLALVGASDAAVPATTITGSNLIPGFPTTFSGASPSPTKPPATISGSNLIPSTAPGMTLNVSGKSLIPSGVKKEGYDDTP